MGFRHTGQEHVEYVLGLDRVVGNACFDLQVLRKADVHHELATAMQVSGVEELPDLG